MAERIQAQIRVGSGGWQTRTSNPSAGSSSGARAGRLPSKLRPILLHLRPDAKNSVSSILVSAAKFEQYLLNYSENKNRTLFEYIFNDARTIFLNIFSIVLKFTVPGRHCPERHYCRRPKHRSSHVVQEVFDDA
jgi:hypothetical protein